MITSILTFVFTAHYILCNASDTSKSDGCVDLCRSSDELFRTCSCDRDCRDHASCCSDSDHALHMSTPNSTEFQCHSDRTVMSVYAKRACLDNFVLNPGTQWACEEAESDQADVLGNVLVTSVKTKMTYWNRVCGICNGEDPDDLRLWTIQVTCPSRHGDTRFNQEYIQQHLHFDRDIEEWGLQVEDEFKVCALSFSQPIWGKLNYCAPNLISGCPIGFPDEGVTKKCHTYHAERKRKGTDQFFRNAHCALCNGVGEEELECVGRNYVQIGAVRGRDQVTVSFDQEWLNKTGEEKYKCSRNNTWDPFNERCRRMPLDLWKELTDKHASTNHASRTLHYSYNFFSSNICLDS